MHRGTKCRCSSSSVGSSSSKDRSTELTGGLVSRSCQDDKSHPPVGLKVLLLIGGGYAAGWAGIIQGSAFLPSVNTFLINVSIPVFK